MSSDSTDLLQAQLRHVTRQLDEVQKEVHELKEEHGMAPLVGSPFTHEIQDKLILTSFRLPMLKAYDGSMNSTEHVVTFQAQMVLYGMSDVMMWRAFPTTFRGPARISNRYTTVKALVARKHEDHKRPHTEKGSMAGGVSTSGRRAYAWAVVEKHPCGTNKPQISFQVGEAEYPNHDDALKLRLTTADLSSMSYTLIGFTRDSIAPLEIIVLPVTLRQEPRSKTLMVTFRVVGLPITYNIILERLTLNMLRAIASTYHRAIKFSTRARVGEARNDPWESRHCYLTVVTLSKKSRAKHPNRVETVVPPPRTSPDYRNSLQQAPVKLFYSFEHCNVSRASNETRNVKTCSKT
ncbi:hypothetical protein B296_00025020 [Ensete ventricosum]|uniref:Retrotransposon gag domain-containing protein n=1 Tax=Ensete ventricosum TaxID=4639 RepID=A0A426ZKN6_ENSVE|nr:hypothetical protein B296_00025020 [Ensete ventricosum]